jgi:hypothetical protein
MMMLACKEYTQVRAIREDRVQLIRSMCQKGQQIEILLTSITCVPSQYLITRDEDHNRYDLAVFEG